MSRCRKCDAMNKVKSVAPEPATKPKPIPNNNIPNPLTSQHPNRERRTLLDLGRAENPMV